MYTKTKDLLKMAEENNTSIMSFTCMDYNMIRGVVEGAERASMPAMCMLYPEHVNIQKTTNKETFVAMAKSLADQVKVPVGFHMDHDYTLENIRSTLESGFDSVMFDGSLHTLEKNIELTRQAVELARKFDAIVEGELGQIVSASDVNLYSDAEMYTDADQAAKFCKQSGVDSLAISIGNAHGLYSAEPHLNLERLEEIRLKCEIPLVLHGGSGIPDDQLEKAFSMGIRKFNLGTDYLIAYYDAVDAYVQAFGNNENPVKIIDSPNFIVHRLSDFIYNKLTTLCKF